MAPQVLNAPELIHDILIHLPFLDLLAVRRVSKRWKLQIDTSSSLQRALFLVPNGRVLLPEHNPDFLGYRPSHHKHDPVLMGASPRLLPVLEQKESLSTAGRAIDFRTIPLTILQSHKHQFLWY